jgi:tRNA pseudouridine55 synthase
LPTRIDGVLVVHKSLGPTSHDVVATARRAVGFGKVGHTGTLDPNASGVLPLVVGRATRLAQHLTSTEKEYEATIRFGIETDTYDSTGQVRSESGEVPARGALDAALERFRGAFDQMPPAFSAKNIDGHRAYDLARRDRVVELAAVPVVAHHLELLSFDPPRARVRLVCSAGFYVRSLAYDLGARSAPAPFSMPWCARARAPSRSAMRCRGPTWPRPRRRRRGAPARQVPSGSACSPR